MIAGHPKNNLDSAPLGGRGEGALAATAKVYCSVGNVRFAGADQNELCCDVTRILPVGTLPTRTTSTYSE